MPRALILRSTIALILVIAFVMSILAVTAPRHTIAIALAAVSSQPEPLPTLDLASMFLRLDLGPEQLAAAGLTPAQVESFAVAFSEELHDAAAVIAQLDQSVANAAASVDALRRLVRSGQATAEDQAALASASAELDQAKSSREALLSDLHALTFELLATEQAQTLAALRAHSEWRVPIEFHAESRTQAEWIALREALANLRIAAELDEDVDKESQQLVFEASSSPAVALAKANLEANAAQTTDAWLQAVNSMEVE